MKNMTMRRSSSLALLCLVLVIAMAGFARLGWAGVTMATEPLFLAKTDPRVLFVLSRDHQLSVKAYTDYSDLDGDGQLDTTYNNAIDYYGYFDSNKCYVYSSTNGRFEPSGAATSHQCSSKWSGNFLNWATMTRMDVLRKVLYGGYRSTDSTTETVLERVLLPRDVHAFAKVYAGGAAEVAKYTPHSYASISLCNVTNISSGTSRSVDTSTNPPKVRVASGSYPRWASDEVTQCQTASSSTIKPTSAATTDLNVRVQVCVSGSTESNCKTYSGGSVKPTGLLQTYGDTDAEIPLRFGLITGSYAKNKSGGLLRRNISRIAGNSTASMNEIDSTTGQFINQGSSDTGIINTINRLRIASYDFSTSKYVNSCGSPGITSFSNGDCIDWGNPLSEMYLEGLRYLAGKTAPTTAFDATDNSSYLTLPKATWSDPLPSAEWCAESNIIAISTGLNSFDTDELTSDISGLSPATLTNQVGTLEGLSGSYLIGENGTTNDKRCTAKSLSNLADAKGICPEMPSVEGGYHVAGLAYANRSVDLRPSYQSQRQARWGISYPEYAARQPVRTHAVALAESLPRFEVPVGSSKIILLPACEANSDANATAATSGWRACSMTDLIMESANYSSDKLVSGSFLVNWEDSTWGNDYDMDGIERLGFCLGSACSSFTMQCPTTASASQTYGPYTTVASNELVVVSCAVQANAGHALRFGYTIAGSTADGAKYPILRGGGKNFNDGSVLPATGVTAPNETTYTASGSVANLLENPLWYAAKYGEPQDKNKSGTFDQADWDANSDGVPDNYNKVSNPATLVTALSKVLQAAAEAPSSASAIATNSTRLYTDTKVYQARFKSNDWSGELLAYDVNADGSINTTPDWNAASKIPAHASRRIITTGCASGTACEFFYANLGATQQAILTSANLVNYLRGDQSLEVKNGGTYRNRSTILGDVINSDPHYVGAEYFGYDRIAGAEGTSYATFMTGKATRTPMLYVGANEGMLHGINATTGTDGGKEHFAFVPKAVIPNMASLASTSYQHKYFVDGRPFAGDAYYGSTGASSDTDKTWKTVLLGTLGGGGKSVFALDVSNVTAVGGASPFTAANVLWEITDTDASCGIGNIIGRAIIGRMNNGEWAAIFGNGYNSTSDRACLYIVNIKTGAVIKRLTTDTQTSNGLAEPVLYDSNSDMTVDAIYAGDLKGNIWKFDVSNSNTTQWESVKDGGTVKPIFTACRDGNADGDCLDAGEVQPITAPLELGPPPTGYSGVMLYFGTGQYFATNDQLNTYVQSVYGFLDSSSYCGSGPSSGACKRSDLLQQTLYASSTSADLRISTDSTPNYASQRGWYLDLLVSGGTADGERVVTPPLLRHGRVIFTSLVPSTAPCDAGGNSWIYEFMATTGGRPTEPVFDINNDALFTDADKAQGTIGGTSVTVPVTSKKILGISQEPAVISAGKIEYKVSSTTMGGIIVTKEKGAAFGTGRVSWRELIE